MIGSVERNITLELGEAGIQERITARQGDSLVHRINISLTSEGVPYRLKDVYTASVWAILPDGSAVTAECEIRDNRCVFVPGGGFFEAGGPVMCRLVLRGADGAELFSPAFSIDAEGDAYGGMEHAAAKEYSKIGEVLLQVLDIKRQCEELVTVGGSTAGEVYEAGEDDYFTLFSLENGAYMRFTWESLRDSIGRYLNGRIDTIGVTDPVSGHRATLAELTGDTTLLTEEDAGRFVSLDGGEVHETVERAVDEWLDCHPEATTSVEDGSISPEKTTFITYKDTGEGAVTETVPCFTNLSDPGSSEWVVGKQMSVSADKYDDYTGSHVTNKIYCTKENTIRITGFDVSDLNTLRIRFFQPDGSSGFTSKASKIARADGNLELYTNVDKDELAQGIYCINLMDVYNRFVGTYTKLDLFTYVQVCGVTNSPEDIIITVDEPIEYETVTSGGRMEYTLDPEIVIPQIKENDEMLTMHEQRLNSQAKRLADHDALLADIGTGVSDAAEIVMPYELAAVVGVECNIFKENIVFSSGSLDNYNIRAELKISGTNIVKNYPDFFRIMATEGQEGDHTFTVRLCDKLTNDVLLEKSAVMHIVPNTSYAASPKKVLFIGDSVTASYRGTMMAEIQYNLSGGGIVSIGTQTGTANDYGFAGSVQHEGYNGAAAYSTLGGGNYVGFTKENVVRDTANPFWNPVTQSFDLDYYMNENGFTQLDAVCINLGLNSLGAVGYATTGLAELVEKIREYNANVPIIVSMCTQLATGPEAKTDITANRKSWKTLQETSVLAQFDGGKIPGVYISTPYMALDMSGDYKTTKEQRSARDTEMIDEVVDYYHPAQKGVLKLADAYYSWILYAIGDK